MEKDLPLHTDIEARLALRLRDLRKERGWSLDDLAARSGVSRATVSRIENAEVSPTAAVLGRLCAAFALTLSRLLAEVEGGSQALVRHDAQPVWVDPETGFRRRSLSPPSPAFDCELLQCELPPGTVIRYPLPPRSGLEHHLYLEAGALEMTVEDQVYTLAPGDCLRYRLQGASGFRVLGPEPARYYLVIR